MKIPLFDIDGTLVKTGSKLQEQALIYSFKKVYGADIDVQEIRIEGMLDNQHIMRVMGARELSEEKIKEKIKEMTKTAGEYFEKHKNETEPEILAGVKNLLEKLKSKNVHMGLLSGNVGQIGWLKMERAGLEDFFTFGGFGDEAYQRVDLVYLAKKHLEEILKKTLNLEDFIIVGDTPRDVQCAKDAGIKVITVASGHYNLETLAKENPDLNVQTLEDKRVLEFIFN